MDDMLFGFSHLESAIAARLAGISFGFDTRRSTRVSLPDDRSKRYELPEPLCLEEYRFGRAMSNPPDRRLIPKFRRSPSFGKVELRGEPLIWDRAANMTIIMIHRYKMKRYQEFRPTRRTSIFKSRGKFGFPSGSTPNVPNTFCPPSRAQADDRDSTRILFRIKSGMVERGIESSDRSIDPISDADIRRFDRDPRRTRDAS